MRKTPKEGFFGWKGFRPDPEEYTTYTVIIAIINFFLLIVALDELFETGENETVILKSSPVEAMFYLKCVMVMCVSFVTAVLIQYKDISVRWGARFIACGLTFTIALLMIIGTI